MIVDEFTGRLMPGRRYSRRPAPGGRGQGRGRDRGRDPDPGHDHAAELLPHVREAGRHDRHGRDRGRRVLRDLQARRGRSSRPTGRCARNDLDDVIYKTKREKYNAIIEEIAELHAKGQPVLVGTVSVEVSRDCCRRMLKRARHHRTTCSTPSTTSRRPRSFARAGQRGRGDDRHQHGRPRHRHQARATWACADGAGSRRGLHIIGTERHESAPHRPPAARPLRPPGRPRLVALLPLARGRPDAPVRLRAHRGHHGPPRRGGGRGDRAPAGHPLDRAARRSGSRSTTSRSASACSSTTT